IGLNFPAVLREQIERGIADIFALRSALRVGCGHAQEVVRVCVHRSHVVGTGRVAARGIGIQGRAKIAVTQKSEVAIDVEVEELVETLPADVAPKFDAMAADYLAEVVRPLEGVSNLRQLPFEVVSNDEASAAADERHTFVSGKGGGNTCQGVVGIRETVR